MLRLDPSTKALRRASPRALAWALALTLYAGGAPPADAAAGPGSEAPAWNELLDALGLVADGETEGGAARLEGLVDRTRRSGDRRAEGIALWGLATARLRQGRPVEAQELAAASRTAFEAAGEASWRRAAEELEAEAGRLLAGGVPDDAFEAAFLAEVGFLEAKRLHFGDALRHFDAGIAHLEGRDRPVEKAGLYAYRGMVLALLQRFEPAEADMNRFSELAVAAAPELEPVIALTRELVLGVARWKFDRVIDELMRIGEIYRDRLPPWFYDNLDLIALLQEGRVQAAAGVCHKVLTAAAGAGSPPGDDMLRIVAMACTAVDVVAAADRGEVPARQLLALGLSVMRVIEVQPEPFRGALQTLAGQFLGLVQKPEAREAWAARTDFRQALGPLQSLIADAVPPEMRGELDSVLSPMIELFVSIKGGTGDAAGTFEVAEEARSRELLDRLVDARLTSMGDGTAAEEIAALRARRDALERRIREEQGNGATAEDQAGRLEELTRVRRDLDAAFRRLALREREAAREEPLPLEEVQRALDGDTTLVAFLTFPSDLDDTLAWVVDRDRVEQVVLPIRAEDLKRRASLLVESLRRRQDVTGTAEDLYRILWSPLRQHLHTRRVLLVPHGPLQELPFAALRDPETGHWLAQQVTLLQAPSASAWARLRARAAGPGGPPLILGTAGDRLPASAREVRSVAALWGVRPLLGAEASEEAFRAAAPGAVLLHVSSHGVLDFHDPLFSRLELAPSAGDAGDPRRDGRLELHEVVNDLDLSAARLVVLPACHTSQGPRSRGDEVTNLARAFLLAGARAAVTTAWAVEDAATAHLMVDFHRHLAAGTEAAEALRRAQEAAIASVDRSHPWYWAAFALHGAGGALPPPADLRTAAQPSGADRVRTGERPGKELEAWR